MARNLILKTQANEIFELLKAATLDPAQFQWDEVGSSHTHGLRISRMTHLPSGYFFLFDYKPRGGRCGEFSPGPSTGRYLYESESWDEQLSMVKGWLLMLHREVTSPDLWATISEEARLSEAASTCDISAEPFSANEREELAASLNEIREYVIATHQLQGEQAAFVTQQFSYLTGAATRVGRKDWLNIAYSVMVNTGIRLAWNSEAFRELLRFATHALRQVLDGGSVLPAP